MRATGEDRETTGEDQGGATAVTNRRGERRGRDAYTMANRRGGGEEEGGKTHT